MTSPTPSSTQPADRPQNDGGLLRADRLPLTVGIMLSASLVAFESLSVVAALPELGRDLASGGDLELLPLVMTAYLLASGVAIATAGPLADAYGPRRVYGIGLSIFGLASLACGFATTLSLLVPLRLVQGAAGGMLIAAGGAAIGLGYPNRLRGRAYAMMSTVWGALGVGGPALAGLLLSALSWHWIFWVNVPLAALGLAIGWRAMPGPAPGAATGRLDVRGIALLAALSTTAVFGLSTWSLRSGAALAVALGLAAIFHRHSRRRDALDNRPPVLRPRHYADMPFRGLALAAALAVAAGVGVENYLPLYLREARGTSIALASWSVFFLTVGWTTAANTMSRLYHRISEQRTMLLGTGMLAPALAASGVVIQLQWHLGWLFALYFVIGFGIGSTTNAALTLTQGTALDAEIGRATAAHQYLRNMALTYGTAIVGATVLFWTPELGAGAHGGSVAGTEAASAAASETAALVQRGFVAGHGIAVLLGLGALAAAWRLQRWRFADPEPEDVATSLVGS